MSNFKKFSVFFLVYLTKLKFKPFLVGICKVKFQNSEYEVHQVGPKDYGSQNFSFLACKGRLEMWYKILRTATARDRRKKIITRPCETEFGSRLQPPP
jgi:hypothetical protein